MVISINKLKKSYSELSAFFSNAGHFLMHYFVAMYFTIILALERDWNTAYESLFELWFPASIFIGLFAIPAGRLADKWSSPGMLIIMFFGMGLATVFCGFSDTQHILMIFLGFLGIFASIYHPVGIPWTIKTSKKKPGMRLAINGLFGGIGASGAAIITGWIIANYGWRASFLIPGILCFILGVVMFFSLQLGFIEEGYYADLVVVRENVNWSVKKDNILYSCGWSPLEGSLFNFEVSHTLVNGHIVYKDGIIFDQKNGKELQFEN